jgi:hypothetical protein
MCLAVAVGGEVGRWGWLATLQRLRCLAGRGKSPQRGRCGLASCPTVVPLPVVRETVRSLDHDGKGKAAAAARRQLPHVARKPRIKSGRMRVSVDGRRPDLFVGPGAPAGSLGSLPPEDLASSRTASLRLVSRKSLAACPGDVDSRLPDTSGSSTTGGSHDNGDGGSLESSSSHGAGDGGLLVNSELQNDLVAAIKAATKSHLALQSTASVRSQSRLG